MVAAAIKPGQGKDQGPDPFDIYSATFTLSAVDVKTLELARIGLGLANVNHNKPVLGFIPGEPVVEFVASVGPNVPGTNKLVIQGWMSHMEPDQGPGRKPFHSEFGVGSGIGDELAMSFNRRGIAQINLRAAANPEKLGEFGMLPNGVRTQLQSTLELGKSELDRINPRVFNVTHETFIRWMPHTQIEGNVVTVVGLLSASDSLYQLR